MNIAIIGSGPAGCTLARIAAETDHTVSLYDKREHIGGNCFDSINSNGILVHNYGPHYFRTNNLSLIKWLSKFTPWIPANYIVRAFVKDKLIPLPINFNTLTALKGSFYSLENFDKHFADNSIPKEIKNAEDQCLSKLGSELYELIFKNYSQKQWGVPLTALPPSITSRIPLRKSFDDRYPSEEFHLLPKNGYTSMFENILKHNSINISLNQEITSKEIFKLKSKHDLIIFTGPIDQYFDYKLGTLEYRSLRFEWKNLDYPFHQPCVQINYPNEHDYTRTVEIKHITGQLSDKTTLCYEYPTLKGDPFYPLLTEQNKTLYEDYVKLAQKELQSKCPTYFIGRLAEFKYLNMDHVFIKARDLGRKLFNYECF